MSEGDLRIDKPTWPGASYRLVTRRRVEEKRLFFYFFFSSKISRRNSKCYFGIMSVEDAYSVTFSCVNQAIPHFRFYLFFYRNFQERKRRRRTRSYFFLHVHKSELTRLNDSGNGGKPPQSSSLRKDQYLPTAIRYRGVMSYQILWYVSGENQINTELFE